RPGAACAGSWSARYGIRAAHRIPPTPWSARWPATAPPLAPTGRHGSPAPSARLRSALASSCCPRMDDGRSHPAPLEGTPGWIRPVVFLGLDFRLPDHVHRREAVRLHLLEPGLGQV